MRKLFLLVSILGMLAMAGTAIVGCVQIPKTKEQAIEFLRPLTVQHFKDTIIIEDDELDTTVTIKTIEGFQDKRGLLGIVHNDNFLRAYIDKKTGITSYQVYQYIRYDSSSWRFYNLVNYMTPSRIPEQQILTTISRNVLDCRTEMFLTKCSYSEHFVWEPSEELLRDIVKLYRDRGLDGNPGKGSIWQFKYKAKGGALDWPDGMPTAEVVALIEIVDEYKKSNGLL